MDKFDNRWIMVTGAGSGIGKAISIAFAKRGANLILNDLPTQKAIYELKDEIQNLGRNCILKLGDISESNTVQSFFKDIENLDVMVNNAGFLREVSITELSDEQWDRMIKVHLYGTFYCSRESVKLMLPRHSGRIINISSDLGQLGCEKLVHYSAAKGGIIAFTKSLAREVGEKGILVNSIAPGGTFTPLVERLGPNYVGVESARYPLKRLGRPEEIAAVAVFLASSGANFMTGQIVGVNGGGVMNG